MRRKILTIFIMAIVLAAASAFAYAADTTLEVKAPDKLPAVGETFEVEVDLTGNPGVNVLEFELVFDGTAVECTEVTEGAILEKMLYSTNTAYSSNSANVSAAALKPAKGDGAVATFHFKLKKEPTTDLGFTFRNADITDEDCKSFPFKEKVARITVNGKDPVIPAANDPGNDPNPSDNPGATDDNPSDNPSEGGSSGNNPPGTDPGNQDNLPGGGTGIIDGVIDDVIEPGVDDTVDDIINPKSPFEDTKGHWGEAYIAKAVQKGLFKGYDEKHFGPNDPVTRGQFITVLYRLAGSPETSAKTTFKDISGEIAEFQKAIAWGFEKKYVNGKSAASFEPKSNVTRQEAMKMLFNYSGGQRGMEAMFTSTYDNRYTDSSEIADWAKDALYWGIYNTLISGTSDTMLEPGGTATREQLAKILVIYTEKFGASGEEANE
ncbi:MAG: S-layer homology domain-containing protein [Firmicutes bacterium]|nr:S-layer homology domain-containing protein [Bacillota bacterium]